MIQIDRHIEILLLDNDCVIVPGLGGFMAHHVAAQYCVDTLSFIPPSRQLGFNAQLQINDSLLAQSYIEAYDISYPEALRRIESEVHELLQKIHNEGKCELNDIGVLSLNSEGNIEFTPCEAGILTPELYGLSSVDVPMLSDTQQKTKVSPLTITPQAEPALDNSDKDIAEDTDDSVDSGRTITIRINTIKHVAATAAVILALFVFSLPFGTSTRPEYKESYMDTGILYRLLPKDIKAPASKKTASPIISINDTIVPVAKDTAPATADKEQTVKVQEKNEEATSKEAVASQHFFSIVLASRVTKANAKIFVDQLKEGGFTKAEVVERANGAKVIYGRFASEEEARQFLNNLRSSAKSFNDGWVMEFN